MHLTRRARIALVVAFAISIFLVIGADCGSSGATTGSTPTTAPNITPTPTHALKWVTTHTFQGNGNKKTAVFTAPDDWKIAWKCQGLTDGSGVDGDLFVSVTGSDNTPIDPSAVSATCKYGKTTTGDTEEHQGGSVYLDVISGLEWSIQVQEMK